MEYVLKHNVLSQKLYRFIGSLVLRMAGLFMKIDNDLILFNSFGGREYNDSPKVIFETMQRQERFRELKYVWAFQEPSKFSIPGCTTVKIDSLEYFIVALKAKYWVSSVNIERGLRFKKKHTRYLNTWHGAGTKKIGRSVKGRNDIDYSNVNVMLIQSEHEKGIFQKDFLVKDDSFLLCGIPRSDELFNVSTERAKFYREKMGIPSGKKVILYAPTWRDSVNKGASYDLAPPINIRKWEEQLSREYVLLFRTHAFTTKVMNLRFNDFVRDASDYPELNHLLILADILITDYSTIVFDYSILGKPFACFGFDYDEYRTERGLYLDMEKEYPNGVFRTEDEVLSWILTMNYDRESEKTRAFKSKYVEVGGDATEQAISALMGNYGL